MTERQQLLLVGGLLIDGTGNPGFRAAVGIRDGRVTVVRGDASEVEADRRIDIRGSVVSPGFIDMHSHSGLVLLGGSDHKPKLHQGVTTEVIGVDGCSYAPFMRQRDLEDFVDFNAGLDGRPELAYDWGRVESYLSRFDSSSPVNVAFLVGNSALRICAVGWDDEGATSAQVADMQAMLREAMEEGAFGLSTGLDYPPGAYASTDELVALSESAANLGGFYHTHARYQLGDRFLDPFREAVEIGNRSGLPVHITHLYRRRNAPGGAREILDLVEQAHEAGTEITFDSYPYPWNSTRLTILLPMSLQSGGPAALRQRLADPGLRKELRAAVDERGANYGGSAVWDQIRLGNFATGEMRKYEGKTIGEVARDRAQHPADVMCDLLLAEDLAINEVGSSPDPATLRDFAVHDLAMVGSDSVFLGDFPSPRTYGTFPLILGDYVREERKMALHNAIRKMTSFPAQRLGLADRGVLKNGSWADVVVFDSATIKATATYDNPRQLALGVHHVIVNGTLVVEAGKLTGATPGRALRR